MNTFKHDMMKISKLFLVNLTFLILAVALQSCGSKNEGIAESQLPNIVLIMADDMGFSDPGFMGSGIQTPNIDKLAKGGIVFNRFYNTGRCCPTRASLLTGLYAHNADLGWMTVSNLGRPGYYGAISDHSLTIAQALKSAGYANYVTGKWHVVYDPNMATDGDKKNWPIQRGFDKYYGMLAGGGGYYEPTTLTYNNTRLTPQEGFYLTEAISDSTVSFLEQHLKNKKEQPFFFYVAHYAPHRPLHALEEDIAKYQGKFSEGWDHFRQQRYEKMQEAGLAEAGWLLSDRPGNIPAWESLDVKERAMWETLMEVYAAQVDRMDQGIGRIIRVLEENGAMNNTMILFLSDNGGCAEPQGQFFDADTISDIGGNTFNQSYRVQWANMSNSPFRLYKSSNHEGGISTPLIVHWPDQIKEPAISNQRGHVIDLMATFLDLTGAEYPLSYQGNEIKPYQGRSLLPAIKGESFDRGALYFEHVGNRAVIDGDWKLVASSSRKPPFSKEWELYNLSSDRAESNNLHDSNPEKVKELAQKWNKWAEANNVLPLDSRGWGKKISSDINKVEANK